MKGWKTILQTNDVQKKAGIAMLIPDKVDLKSKKVRDKDGQYVIVKGKNS